MLPTHHFQRAMRIGRENGLVPDGPEIPRPVPEEQIEHRLGLGRADQSGDGRIGQRLIPGVQGLAKGGGGRRRLGHERLADRTHGPVAFAHILGLRPLEVVQPPENRQPAVRFRRRQPSQMQRLDHQHRMELEPHARPRLDVPHPRQQQGGQHLAVRRPLADPFGYPLHDTVTRRVLDQAHQRFDLRYQADTLGVHAGLVRRNRRQSQPGLPSAVQGQRGPRGRRSQKPATRRHYRHGILLPNPTTWHCRPEVAGRKRSLPATMLAAGPPTRTGATPYGILGATPSQGNVRPP